MMSIAQDVEEWMERKGVSIDQVADVFQKPSKRVERNDGTTAYFGRGLVVIIDQDDVVISVGWSMVGAPQKGMPKAKGTGGGSTIPSTWEELDEKAQTVGLTLQLLPGGHVAYYDTKGKQIAVRPASSSDYRGVRNCALFLIRNGYNVRRK